MKRILRIILRMWCVRKALNVYSGINGDVSVDVSVFAQTIYNYITKGKPYKEDWF